MRISTRREFLRTAARLAPGVLLVPTWASHALNSVYLGAPDFSVGHVIREVAGLRPLRDGGIRLEVETLNRKYLVHNYGHGGSGFTLAWGSALEAADLIAAAGVPGREVAVLGGGVVGLTTARILLERGYRVQVYTAQMSPDTTSDLAGAQWSPSFISPGRTPAEAARFHRMLKTSFARYATIEGPTYGVYLRPNFIADGFHDGLQDVPAGVLNPAQKFKPLPFANVRLGGTKFDSWLIEPPQFMPALIADLRSRGVTFLPRTFNSTTEIERLAEPLVVNCTGLASARLFGDRQLIPMKGQLIWLKPQPKLNYALLHQGYIFCRSDAIVLGGSYEKNNFDLRIDPRVSAHILAINRRFFTA